PEAKAGSAGWIAQTVTGGAGMLLPLVASGRLTGGVLKGAGRALETGTAGSGLGFLEAGGAASKLLASDHTAMIVGAGAYGGARTPEPGSTRLGNAVSTAVGFSAFEFGNRLVGDLPMSASLPLRTATKLSARAAIGAAGGLSQYETGTLISNHDFGTANGAEQSLLSGAAMNSLLPVVSRTGNSVFDEALVRASRPISAESFASRSGMANNNEISQLISQTPLTRVKQGDSSANIDQKKNVISLNFGDGPENLAHELSHRVSAQDPQIEARFQQAAALLAKDPQEAQAQYEAIRRDQESLAIDAGNRARVAAGQEPAAPVPADSIKSMPVSEGRTYGDLWQDEFQQFKNSGGKFRPQSDYAGELQTYEQAKTQPLEAIQRFRDAENKPYLSITTLRRSAHPWFYNLEEIPDSFDYIGFDRSADGAFQRYWKAERVRSNGTMWGGTLDIFGQPVRTDYGTAKAIETFADGSTRYHILHGYNDVPNNVVLHVFPNGVETQFGPATSIIHSEDGTSLYRKLDGTEAIRYGTPEENWFGSVKEQEERPDGSVIYRLADGNSEYGLSQGDIVEWHPEPNPLGTVFGAASARPMFENIESVLRGKEQTTYIRPDNTHLVLNKVDNQLQVADYDENGQAVFTGPVDSVVEHYPNGLRTNFGPATAIEFRGDSTLYHTAPFDDRPLSAVTQVFDSPTVIDGRFDPVVAARQLENGKTHLFTSSGSKVELFSLPTRTRFDNVTAVERAPEGWTKHYTSGGTVIEEYPQGIQTS
ncbi:MAG TPA: hypothetical protein V6C72_15380, partial [Chroococcales cyanobacterium]